MCRKAVIAWEKFSQIVATIVAIIKNSSFEKRADRSVVLGKSIPGHTKTTSTVIINKLTIIHFIASTLYDARPSDGVSRWMAVILNVGRLLPQHTNI